MRNLINFFWRYYNTFLFLFLELIGVLLLVNYNVHHSVKFLSWTGDLTGGMYATVFNFKEYINLKDANVRLSEENAWLKSKLEESYLHSEFSFHSYTDSVYQQQYQFTAAKVINNTIDLTDNFLILDKGSNNGVLPGMGVLGSNGVVGIVKEVSSSYAVVMSILHKDFRHAASLKKSGYFGELKWEQQGPEWAILDAIPSHVELTKGDTLVSRGGELAIFPKGEMVGFVESWEQPEGSNFYRIKVKLSTNYRNINHVKVIRHLKHEELKALIEEVQND